MDELLVQWGALAGFAALIAFLINILKTVGIVKEDQAPTWSAGLNLAGLVGLLIMKIYVPQVDIEGLDQQVAQAVEVGTVIFSYVLQLLSSKLTHSIVRGVPGIGKYLT
jgi:hypothetical protein